MLSRGRSAARIGATRQQRPLRRTGGALALCGAARPGGEAASHCRFSRSLAWQRDSRTAFSTAQAARGEAHEKPSDRTADDDDDAIPIEPLQQRAPAGTSPAALPVTCHGCGAFTQWVYPDEAGFYTLTRKTVKAYLRYHSPSVVGSSERVAARSAPDIIFCVDYWGI
ncbi:hypothetical protein KEM52_005735 [Ascosphaera acerosa]|nr:hypothetical protein KEM52_005735 [Ascosphaera acerosa]